METYEVKIVMEYWVTVEADTRKEAEQKAYEEHEEWLHTGTLHDAKAYEVATDDDEETED